MKRKINLPFCAFIIFSTILLFSCSKENEIIDDKTQAAKSTIELNNLQFKNLNDSIYPLDSTPFIELKRSYGLYGNINNNEKKQQISKTGLITTMTEDNSIYSIISQFQGIDFHIRTVDSYFGKNTIRTNGKGKALTLSPQSDNSQEQLFYITILPATSGIPYLIYSRKEGAPIGVGSTSSAPNNYIPYVQNSGTTSLFGFSWDFNFTSDSTALNIANQDIPISTNPSAPYGGIKYPVITANTNGSLSAIVPNGGIGQQLNLEPNDVFNINSLELLTDQGTIVSSVPKTIKSGQESNGGSTNLQRTLTIAETLTDQYSFKESYGTTTKTNTSGNFGIKLEVVSFGGSYSIENTVQQSVEYSKNSSKSITVTDQYALTIPPHKRYTWKYTAISHTVRVPYFAHCTGVNTQKLFRIKGLFNDVEYTTYQFELTESDYNPSMANTASVEKNTSVKAKIIKTGNTKVSYNK